MKTEVKTGAIMPQANGQLGLPEAVREKGGSSSKGMGHASSNTWISDLQPPVL